MLTKLAHLFVIRTKFQAFLVIYTLATGAVERGVHYIVQYPGLGGAILFLVCPLGVVMAGGKLIDSVAQT